MVAATTWGASSKAGAIISAGMPPMSAATLPGWSAGARFSAWRAGGEFSGGGGGAGGGVGGEVEADAHDQRDRVADEADLAVGQRWLRRVGHRLAHRRVPRLVDAGVD